MPTSDPRNRRPDATAQRMLPSARRRHRETSAREASRETLWTPDIDRQARVRIAEYWALLEDGQAGDQLARDIARLLRLHAGWQMPDTVHPSYITTDTANDLVVDVVAAVHGALSLRGNTSKAENYADVVNRVLREHRVSYKFVDAELVPFESDELFVGVVEPALLVTSEYQRAHDAYLDALKQVSAGYPGNAITDAATALQELLTLMGCEGNALGPLIKDAKNKGLLAPHDGPLTDGITKILDWVSADRSETGDAHKHSTATESDAWLTVHVVGALIVRLTDQALPRGS